jgi:hypothetical protein
MPDFQKNIDCGSNLNSAAHNTRDAPITILGLNLSNYFFAMMLKSRAGYVMLRKLHTLMYLPIWVFGVKREKDSGARIRRSNSYTHRGYDSPLYSQKRYIQSGQSGKIFWC